MLKALVDLIKIVWDLLVHPWAVLLLCAVVLVAGVAYVHFKPQILALIAKLKGDL
jgi:hypothetical protein